jgi:hypothetical protein
MDDDDAAEIAPAQPELLTLDAVLTLTRARSIETRIHCFSEAIPQALSTDVPSDAVALLSDTIVSLLEVYDDSRSTHACLQAIGALGRRSDFGPDFVRALVARLLAETSSSVPLTPSGKLFALRSLCAALRADFEAATGTAAAPRQGFTALALAKGSLLHDIEADGRRRALVRCARSAFRGVLSCANEAPGRYAAAVLALENPGPPACAIAGAVLDPRLRLAEQPATREAWLGLYASAVIGSAQPPTVGMQWAFAPVLTTATEAEWSKTLLPAALKALKRTPDAVLALMPPLLEALPATVPIGASMPSLLEALQPLLLGAATPRADATVSCLGVLCKRCGSAAALGAAAQLATTKPSAIPGSQQKASFADALAELATPLLAENGGTVKEADGVVTALLALAAKETQEGPRATILAAAGRWMPLAAAAASCATAFAKGLGEKDAEVRRAHVGGILAALEACAAASPPPATLVAAISSLGEPLLALIKPALTKPPASGAARADALGVLCCLREGGQLCPVVEQQCTKEKLWTLTLKAKDSFVWHTEPLAAASERELCLLNRLLEGTLRTPAQLALCGDGGVLLFRQLFQLIAHPMAAPRRAADKALSQYVATMPCEAAERLLSALETVVKKAPELAAAAEDANEADSVAALAAAAAARAPRLANAAAVVLAGAHSSEGLLPRILLLCHHPAIVSQGEGPWPTLFLLWQRERSVVQLLQANARAIAAHLSGDKGALASSAETRVAALGGLRALLGVAGDLAAPELLTPILDGLRESCQTLGAVGAMGMRILQTPDGRLSSDQPLVSDESAEVSAEGARGGGDGGADWEAEVRAKLKKKPEEKASVKSAKGVEKKSSSSKQDAQRERQLEEEKAVRTTLHEARALLACQAELVTTVCVGAPVAAQPWLGKLLPVLLPLPALPVLQLSGTLPTWMAPLFDALVGCGNSYVRARLALMSQALLASASEPSEPVASGSTLCTQLRVILGDMAAGLRSPLPSSSASLLLPVLQRAMHADGKGEAAAAVHEAAFKLLCLHSEARLALTQRERRLQTRLLLAAVERGDRWHAAAADALRQVAASLRPDALEELLNGALYPESAKVRIAAVEALRCVPVAGDEPAQASEGAEPVHFTVHFTALRWLLRFDADTECAALGKSAWMERADGSDEPPSGLDAELLPLLASEELRIRQQVALALAAAGAELPKLFALYNKSLPAEKPSDARARMLALEPVDDPDDWRSRQGVALTLAALAPRLRAREQLPLVFAFFKRALGDEHEMVAQQMVAAGRDIIERQPDAEAMVTMLVPLLESFLAEPATTEVHDRIRQGVVLYMGSLATHIPPDDPKVAQVVTRLMAALGTPSEVVQRTISQSLASLVSKPAVKANAPEYLATLQKTLTTTPSYAERRGAAFGLAGVVKGLGIPSLKQHGVMTALQAAVESKAKGEQAADAREGALHAFECLCETLGRLFEPYIITILPMLLTCVSDGSGPVRHAAVSASQRIMSQLSAQGVKMVLPSLLNALDEEKWRTKHAAVELLGSMAYCAPKQLSATLPQVVPRLTEALTHSHPKVKEGANAALGSVGAVIKNPEIAQLVPTLLAALSEPSTKTGAAIDALAHCQFEHCVDPPSLALIVPVLHRGLRERSAQGKRKASHITGNMCSLLSERRDIVPYLGQLLPELRAVLLDPIPEVRSTGAKALGRLCAGLGEEQFPDLLPWLLDSLSKGGSTVERAGAAQGLAEVVGALGDAKVRQMLPTLIDGCSVGTPSSREGYSMVWVHLPIVLGKRFEPFLGEVIPVVLARLSDDSGAVRDTCMRAALGMIAIYLEAAAALLLPPLQRGLSDVNYRIRQASAELLGELMQRLTGGDPVEVLEVGAKPPEDSVFANAIPVEQQHALLAAIYIARNDVHVAVRSASSTLWKALIGNAPKTLRIILVPLTEQLISGLSTEDEDQQQAAAQAMGELVSKLSERVLPKLLPTLQQCLTSADAARRRGVCLGLSELMVATGRDVITDFLGGIIPCVREGLCDEDSSVREAAARSFSQLQRILGQQAIYEIVPALLQLLRSDDALLVAKGQNGLREVMGQRPQAVVPYLLPKLLAPPITLAHARALGAVAEVAGAALHTHLDVVLPALWKETYLEAEVAPNQRSVDPDLRDALVASASAVALAVQADGLHFLIGEIRTATTTKAKAHVRIAAAALIETVCKSSTLDLSVHHSNLIQSLIGMFHAEEPAVQRSGIRGLDNLIKSLPKERYPLHVAALREAVKSVSTEHRANELAAGASRDEPSFLPAFCLPNGLGALVAVHLQGLMTGTPELREQSAAALGEAVGLTSPAALKPYVIQITGPLIRIVGDRFPPAVKAAILHTLTLLITKGSILLKPFVPQLQTTFVKALSDPAKVVRARGATALSHLISLATRVEPLATEIHNTLSTADAGVQVALLCALAGVLRGISQPLSEALVAKIQASALELLCADDDELSFAAATLIGACGRWTPLDELHDNIEAATTACGAEPWQQQLRALRGYQSLLRNAPVAALKPLLSTIFDAAGEAAKHEKIDLRMPASHALVRVAVNMAEPAAEDVADAATEGAEPEELALASAMAVPPSLYGLLVELLADDVLEVRVSALHALKTMCKLRPALLRASGCKLAGLVLPGIAQNCQDSRRMQVSGAAKRTMMHVLAVVGWCSPEEVAQHLPRSNEAAAYTAEFVKKTFARIAGTESEEGELSDADV